MALTFPRELRAEMFLGGQWRDISTAVRQNPAVVFTYGGKDESPKASPARCTFELDDGPGKGNGDYNPTNPTGQWFGKLGRNTPVRLALAYGNDAFTRTSASGWGSSPDMGAWSSFSSAGTVASDISANQGRHQITSTNAFTAQYLAGVSVKNVDTYVEFAFDTAVTVAGGNLEVANLMLRGQNTTTYYMLRVSITTAQAITLQLMVGSSQVLYGPVTVGTFWGTTAPMSIRFQADGNTFRGKTWRTSDGEPLAWGLEYSHGDVYGAGWVGIRSGVSTGNSNSKPVNFLYDNYTVRIPRFAGETSKMVPVSEVSLTTTGQHVNARTQVEASGVLRRLQQGSKVLKTPFERWITDANPFSVVEYYPLDEDIDAADRGQSPLTGKVVQLAQTSGVTPSGAFKWGEDAKRMSMDKALLIKSGGEVGLDVDSRGSYGQQVAFTWTHKLSAQSFGGCFMFLTNGDFINIEMNLNGLFTLTYYDVSATPHVMFNLVPGSWVNDDNQWYNVGVSIDRNIIGGNTTFVLAFEGQTVSTYSVTYPGIVSGQPMQWVFITADTDATYTMTLAHAATYSNDLFDGALGNDLSGWFRGALNGWAGEEAGTRFARMLPEEGVPYGLVGYPTVSPTMGGQGRKTILQLAQDCLDVAQGALFEPRGSTGLVLRNTASMTGQTPALTLDYSAGQVATPFRPTNDDQGVVNDVTAKRPLGAEYRYEQVTGPLNTADPGTNDDAVGRYDTTVTVNVQNDNGLGDAAGFRVQLGTVDSPRFPTLTVDLAASGVVSGAKTVPALDVGIGDLVVVSNASAARIYDDVRLIVRGYTETINTNRQHKITFNTTPADVFDGLILDDTTYSRADSSTSATAGTLTTTATSMSVSTTDSGDLWGSANVPFDVIVAGERMTVTAVTGATSPQTFTVTRSVNGVVKTHVAGETVRLFRPIHLVL